MTLFDGTNENTVRSSLANIFNLTLDNFNVYFNFFMINYYHLNKTSDKDSVEEFTKLFSFSDINNIKFDYINIFHLTTQDKELFDLKRYGLTDLKNVLTNDTLHKIFLERKDIKFEFSDEIILEYKGKKNKSL